ncbi:MAG: hypothetical protein Q7J34_09290 [Bacteroidales bacterium]|nr:hypothetical protein [Bacteroidales bacterium]
MKERNDIEDLVRNSYLNGQVPSSEGAWEKLRFRLFWMNIRKRSLIYLSAIGLVILITSLVFIHGDSFENAGKSNETVKSEALSSEFQTSPELNDSHKDEIAKPATLTHQNIQIPAYSTPSKSKKYTNTNKIPTDFSPKDFDVVVDNSRNQEIANEIPKTITKNEDLKATDSTIVVQKEVRKDSKEKLLPSSPWKMTLEVYAGPGYDFATLTENESYNTHIELRNLHESGSLGTQSGLGMIFSKGPLVLSCGINYKRFVRHAVYHIPTEQTDPEKSYYLYDTTFVYVYDPPFYGQPVVLAIDSAFVDIKKWLEWSGNRQYSYIEIPFSIGFGKTWNNGGFELTAGISPAFLVSSTGRLLNEHNTALLENESLKDVLKSVKMNYSMRFTSWYALDDRWAFQTGIWAQMGSSPYKTLHYPVQENEFSAGILFGLRYQLKMPEKN